MLIAKPNWFSEANNLKAILLIFLLWIGAAAQTANPPRKLAVTIDDLPYAGTRLATLRDAQRATKAILRTLRAHQAPAIGFVNERKLEVKGEKAARIALLQQWIDAGMILGNHTYSHPDFNALTVEQFEEEIIKGEVVTRRLLHAHQPYQLYFRHPMNHNGDPLSKQEAIEAFLAARGYKVAPHTIENSDFIFNEIYVSAQRNKDAALAKRLRETYLELTIAATAFAETISPQIFGREISQTLLIHANDLNADCLDELLTSLAARGYRFVSLDEAMSDPAYQTKITYTSKFGPTWLWRWNKSKGVNVSFDKDPDPPKWLMDLYRQQH
jgi:peptidoglycan/xylan/chitin deacetylase (PgdA/CDA1 family)